MEGNPVADTRLEPSIEDQFLELVCADEDLLRTEFEAIITAEWATPPPGRPPGHPARIPSRPTGTRRQRPPRFGRLRQRPRHPGIGGWARQRSPPLRQSDQPPKGR